MRLPWIAGRESYQQLSFGYCHRNLKEVMCGRGQAPNIVVDVSLQNGATQAIAERGIIRATGRMMLRVVRRYKIFVLSALTLIF